MDNVVSILNHRFALDLFPGTIIHVDKYTDVEGGAFNLPVISTTHTEAVFRSATTDEDLRLFAYAIDLPLYPTQQVLLLATGTLTLGFVDAAKGRIYYTIRNIARKLRLGISPMWVLAISLICAAVPYVVYGPLPFEDYLLPFAITWVLYFTQNKILNILIRREIRKKLLK